jgi:forkhead box protein K
MLLLISGDNCYTTEIRTIGAPAYGAPLDQKRTALQSFPWLFAAFKLTTTMATVIAHNTQDTLNSAATVVHTTDDVTEEPSSDKISAYYSLVFPNFTYYLQTLNVTIGRRCIPNNTASSSDSPQVDVDLGPLKSVSRLHARIVYDDDEERFVLVVVGRNGAWVDGVWSGSGSRVSLGDR